MNAVWLTFASQASEGMAANQESSKGSVTLLSSANEYSQCSFARSLCGVTHPYGAGNNINIFTLNLKYVTILSGTTRTGIVGSTL